MLGIILYYISGWDLTSSSGLLFPFRKLVVGVPFKKKEEGRRERKKRKKRKKKEDRRKKKKKKEEETAR